MRVYILFISLIPIVWGNEILSLRAGESEIYTFAPYRKINFSMEVLTADSDVGLNITSKHNHVNGKFEEYDAIIDMDNEFGYITLNNDYALSTIKIKVKIDNVVDSPPSTLHLKTPDAPVIYYYREWNNFIIIFLSCLAVVTFLLILLIFALCYCVHMDKREMLEKFNSRFRGKATQIELDEMI